MLHEHISKSGGSQENNAPGECCERGSDSAGEALTEKKKKKNQLFLVFAAVLGREKDIKYTG